MENNQTGRILLTSYLQKRSKLLKIWRNRYCVLTENFLLTYKSAEKNSQSSNSIKLSGCISVKDADKILDKKYCFELTTKKRIFYFQAKNQENKEEWIDTVNKILEMNKQRPENDKENNKNDDSNIEIVNANNNDDDSNSSGDN